MSDGEDGWVFLEGGRGRGRTQGEVFLLKTGSGEGCAVHVEVVEKEEAFALMMRSPGVDEEVEEELWRVTKENLHVDSSSGDQIEVVALIDGPAILFRLRKGDKTLVDGLHLAWCSNDERCHSHTCTSTNRGILATTFVNIAKSSALLELPLSELEITETGSDKFRLKYGSGNTYVPKAFEKRALCGVCFPEGPDEGIVLAVHRPEGTDSEWMAILLRDCGELASISLVASPRAMVTFDDELGSRYLVIQNQDGSCSVDIYDITDMKFGNAVCHIVGVSEISNSGEHGLACSPPITGQATIDKVDDRYSLSTRIEDNGSLVVELRSFNFVKAPEGGTREDGTLGTGIAQGHAVLLTRLREECVALADLSASVEKKVDMLRSGAQLLSTIGTADSVLRIIDYSLNVIEGKYVVRATIRGDAVGNREYHLKDIALLVLRENGECNGECTYAKSIKPGTVSEVVTTIGSPQQLRGARFVTFVLSGYEVEELQVPTNSGQRHAYVQNCGRRELHRSCCTREITFHHEKDILIFARAKEGHEDSLESFVRHLGLQNQNPSASDIDSSVTVQMRCGKTFAECNVRGPSLLRIDHVIACLREKAAEYELEFSEDRSVSAAKVQQLATAVDRLHSDLEMSMSYLHAGEELNLSSSEKESRRRKMREAKLLSNLSLLRIADFGM